MSFYTSLIDRVLWPVWERGLRRRATPTLLGDLRKNESTPLSHLIAGQELALSDLLRHCEASVPRYRDAIKAAGLGGGTNVTLPDLKKLPVLTRVDAGASVHERTSVLPPVPNIRKTTGGTTGEPLVILYDQTSENWRQAIKLRGFGWAGFRVGAPSIHYWGAASTVKGRFHSVKAAADQRLKRETWIDCNDQTDAALAAAVATFAEVKPDFLFAYAQAAAALARYINTNKLRDWPEVRVICGAERVFPDDRIALEAAFGEVFETYGCREFMLIGSECGAHNGLHTSMENLIVEILDDDGNDVDPGTVGNVVITDLHNYGCPLIRYQNGDRAAAMPELPECPCGRAHTRLTPIEGRVTETLRNGNGESIGGMTFNLIFSPLAEHVRQFQVHQKSDSSVTVRVIPRSGTELSPSVGEHLKAAAIKYLPGIEIDIEVTEEIANTASGKKRIVIVDPADA